MSNDDEDGAFLGFCGLPNTLDELSSESGLSVAVSRLNGLSAGSRWTSCCVGLSGMAGQGSMILGADCLCRGETL